MPCMWTTCPEPRPRPQRTAGFSLLSAIFIVVFLAVLAAAVASVSVNQQVGSANELMAAKAFQAARAGQEWGAYQLLFPPPPPVPGVDAPPNCFADTHIALDGALSGLTVTVQCLSKTGPVTDGDVSKTFYQLQATACNQPVGGSCATLPATPGANYVERRLNWTLAR